MPRLLSWRRSEGRDTNLIIAGLLHDCIDDRGVTLGPPAASRNYGDGGRRWLYQCGVFFAQPLLDITPQLPCQRRQVFGFLDRHRDRSVVGNLVAFAPVGVEGVDERGVGAERVFKGVQRDGVVAGEVGVGSVARGMQGDGGSRERGAIRAIESPFRAQGGNAGVSEVSIRQRQQSGELVF